MADDLVVLRLSKEYTSNGDTGGCRVKTSRANSGLLFISSDLLYFMVGMERPKILTSMEEPSKVLYKDETGRSPAIPPWALPDHCIWLPHGGGEGMVTIYTKTDICLPIGLALVRSVREPATVVYPRESRALTLRVMHCPSSLEPLLIKVPIWHCLVAKDQDQGSHHGVKERKR